MARLPSPGGDQGTWGDILNDFLATVHNNDGTLKDNVVSASSLAPGAVDTTSIQDATISEAKLDSALVTKINSGGGTVPDATSSVKGIVQLTGDLGGTAASPTVPGLATKEPTLTAGTTSQYYRGDKSWQTLDKTTVGLSNVDNTSDANKPVSSAQQTALNGKEPTISAGTTTQYWRGDKSWQTLDKTAVGLANVDNTSDLNKPISTATQAALDTKAAASAVGAKVLLIDNAAALPPGTPAGVVVVVKS